MQSFSQNFASCYDLKSLIKKPTCVKWEASCTDLILINNKSYFKHYKTFAMRASDFCKLIATATKTYFVKSDPKIKYYWDYKKFDTDTFENGLSHQLTFPPSAFQKVALK